MNGLSLFPSFVAISRSVLDQASPQVSRNGPTGAIEHGWGTSRTVLDLRFIQSFSETM